MGKEYQVDKQVNNFNSNFADESIQTNKIFYGQEQQNQQLNNTSFAENQYLNNIPNDLDDEQETLNNLHLQQGYTTPVVPWVDATDYNLYLNLGNAFFRGSTANTYAANITRCYNRTLYVVYKSTLLYQWRLYYGSFEDQVYNTTLFVSNATNSLMICYDALENYVYYLQVKYTQFGSSFTNVLTSFFQNLIGNAILLTRYQKTLTDQYAAKDLVGLAENIGKLAKLLLDFSPIESAQLYDSNYSNGKVQLRDQNALYEYYIRQADMIDNKILNTVEENKNFILKQQQQTQEKCEEKDVFAYEKQFIIVENKRTRQIYKLQQTNSNQVSPKGIQKISSVGGLMGFFRGFLNGTRTYQTNNMTRCEQLTVQKWDQGMLKLINNTLDGNFFKAGWSLLDIIYNLHPITLSCYTGMKEGFWGLGNYGRTLYPSAVMDNVVFNFGNIFDAFRDTILFFTASSRGEFDLPFEAGFATGEAVWQIMKPPTNPKPKYPY